MDADSKTFVIYIAIQESEKIIVHLKKKVQIKTQDKNQGGAQIKDLIFDKVSTKILVEYSDYSNVFLAENTIELLKHIKMNDYTIKLKENK